MTTNRQPSILARDRNGEHSLSVSAPRSNRVSVALSSETLCIGRQQEVTEIRALLMDPACRLVTLVGPGGIGKTTLALQIADQFSTERLRDSFCDGIYVISLQPVPTADLIIATLADELGLALNGSEEPLLQVGHYLQEKNLLLLLDNFEHLLAGVDVLTSILHAAPGVKAIVTSREALNLHEEWLYPVHGLAYPVQEHAQHEIDIDISHERYGALQLFMERARRVRPTFSLAEEESCVIRICQLVGGMPLALELAATWVKSLRCTEICAQIEQNLDFLTARVRNVLPRHQSMQAVFDTSWSLLSEEEQAVFMRLCVFRGGFTAEAARSIGDAALTTLLSLVDKSLLRWEDHGRYHVHELLRQYAQAKLEQSSQTAAQVREAHCAYYIEFLYQRKEDVIGAKQGEIIHAMEEELDNIRVAWQCSITGNKAAAFPKMAQALVHFYQIRSRYREGADAYEQAILALDESPTPTKDSQIALIVLSVYLGWLYIRLGKLEQATAVLQRCQTLYAELDIPPLSGYTTDPDAPLGLVYSIQGNFVEAVRLAERSVRRSIRHHHQPNLMQAHYVLIGANLQQGAYTKAHYHAQQALAITQELNDRWFMATCLIESGQIEEALGNYGSAEEQFQTSYRLRKELGDPGGMAVALNRLGHLALRQNQLAQAQERYEQSRIMCAESSDRGSLATAWEGLGNLATAQGDYPKAAQYYHDALQVAIKIQFVPLVFSLFLHIGELFLKTNHEPRGLMLLAMTRSHPACAHAIRAQAAQLLDQYQDATRLADCERAADGTPDAPVRAESADSPAYAAESVESVASLLLIDLMGIASSAPAPQLARHPALSTTPDLVEPLTEREVEILPLLAQGMTNHEIAEKLIVAVGTVKAHNHSIFGKLGVNNRTSAVARARALSLL